MTNEMIKPKRKWWKALLIVGVVISVLLLLYRETNLLEVWWWKELKLRPKIEERISEGYVDSSLAQMKNNLLAGQSTPMMDWMWLDLSMEYGRYDYEVEGYVSAQLNPTYHHDLTSNERSRLLFYQKEIERFRNTEDKLEELLGDRLELSIDEAEDLSEELSELINDPDYDPSELYYYMALLTRDSDRKITLYEEAYRLNRNNYVAACMAAEMYWAKEDLQAAHDILEPAYAREKEICIVTRDLAVAELLMGNADRAVELAKEAYNLDPSDICVGDTYLITLMESGQAEKMKEFEDEKAVVTHSNIYQTYIGAYQDGEITLAEVFDFNQGSENSF